MVTLVAASVKLPVEVVVVDPETSTVTVPVEGAKVESPEYVAVITCSPEVLDEKV